MICPNCGEIFEPKPQRGKAQKYCSPPCRIRFGARKWQREQLVKDPDYNRRQDVKKLYGLTLEQYDAIVCEPCWICGEVHKKRFLDHDHVTGTPRGALCGRCNSGLGMFREDPKLLIRAVEYLKKTKKKGRK